MKDRAKLKLFLSLTLSICLWALVLLLPDSDLAYYFLLLIPFGWIFFYQWRGIFYSVLAIEVLAVLEIFYDSQSLPDILGYENQLALTILGILTFIYSFFVWMLLAFLKSIASDLK